MSYSRWHDPRYWPTFRDAMLETHPGVTAGGLEAARAYNAERYHYQGIGRYEPEGVYKRGLADLAALAGLLGAGPFLFGDRPHGADAACYGFLANIHFYRIETPFRGFIGARPVSRLPAPRADTHPKQRRKHLRAGGRGPLRRFARR